jgi:hypothetical protein
MIFFFFLLYTKTIFTFPSSNKQKERDLVPSRGILREILCWHWQHQLRRCPFLAHILSRTNFIKFVKWIWNQNLIQSLHKPDYQKKKLKIKKEEKKSTFSNSSDLIIHYFSFLSMLSSLNINSSFLRYSNIYY